MKKIFNTIRFKVFFAVSFLVATIVILCVILTSTLAEDYFLSEVTDSLGDTYNKICLIFENESLSDNQRKNEIEKLCNNSNVHAMVFEDNKIAYTSLPMDSARFLRGSTPPQDTPPPSRTPDRVREYPHHKSSSSKKVLEETQAYKIISSYIPQFDAYNIELLGERDNMRIFLQSSAAAISENVDIFNRFFISLGILAVILAGIFAYFISRKFTNPIHKLSGIAEKMSKLDFSEKYEGKAVDEIGLLGKSINILSTELERNIEKLKNANLKLLKDIDLKEKTDCQRREFLSAVSHELKTPISIIEAYTEGLLEMELSAEDRKYYLDVIADEAGKMNTLIVKLMSLMELEANTDKIELEKYDITEQIQILLEDKKILFEQNKAKIEFLNTSKYYVYADPFLIDEALINFLVNAMKYSSGEKKIKIWTEETLDNKVRINVFNSGSYIDEQDLENIWNSFYKADKARTRDGGSRGLGLSIVKAIAASHKNSCGAYNTDSGVVFWLEVDKA